MLSCQWQKMAAGGRTPSVEADQKWPMRSLRGDDVMRSVQTILHPTDFSDNSRSAFQTACSLAKDHKARLILFHVVSTNGAAKTPDATPNPLEAAESQQCLKD